MRIEILIGPADGAIVEIGQRTTIGRAATNDVALPYFGSLSRQHGEITVSGGVATFRDTGNEGAGSTFGTAVHSHDKGRVELKGTQVELRDGDILVLGNSAWLRFLQGDRNA